MMIKIFTNNVELDTAGADAKAVALDDFVNSHYNPDNAYFRESLVNELFQADVVVTDEPGEYELNQAEKNQDIGKNNLYDGPECLIDCEDTPFEKTPSKTPGEEYTITPENTKTQESTYTPLPPPSNTPEDTPQPPPSVTPSPPPSPSVTPTVELPSVTPPVYESPSPSPSPTEDTVPSYTPQTPSPSPSNTPTSEDKTATPTPTGTVTASTTPGHSQTPTYENTRHQRQSTETQPVSDGGNLDYIILNNSGSDAGISGVVLMAALGIATIGTVAALNYDKIVAGAKGLKQRISSYIAEKRNTKY